jgi:3-hydroxybutyryl-CoA dehydratase
MADPSLITSVAVGLENSPNQLFADDINPGDEFPGQTRVLSEQAFKQFADLTGDAHPIHYDEEFARKTHYGARLAHGLLIGAFTALGATKLSPRIERSLIAFLEQSTRFLRPVFVGDTITTAFVVSEVRLNQEKKTGVVTFQIPVRNQAGEIVAEAQHRYLLHMRASGGGSA